MGKYENLWKRSKDGSYASERSFLRYAIIATSFFLIFICFVTRDNIIRWVQALFEQRAQQRQIETLIQQNRELDARISTMSHNRDSLEKYARENFGFAEPGDDVYIIE